MSFFHVPKNLIKKHVSYSVQISHLAVGCRQGISLLVSDWISQFFHRRAQSLLSDTAAHSHRQKYPANWMAYVRHSPQGTAPCVCVCVCTTERQIVGEWKRATAGKQEDRKVSFSPFLWTNTLSVGAWEKGYELTYLQRKLGWWLSKINWTPKCPAQLFLRGLCGKTWIVFQTWRWKLWIVSTCGKGTRKYVGQIGLCQLCLLCSSDGLIEPDVALLLWLPLWLGLYLSSHSCYSH